MDILKILSRGTKKSGTQPIAPAPSNKPANPQLYHDPRGHKRKRANEAPLPQAVDENAEDVDFFAPKEVQKPAAPEPEEPPSATVGSADEPARLDEEEVRQVLRSHRLRFSLLSDHEEKPSKVKKSKKKEKLTAKAKKAKLQLHPQPLTSFTELRAKYKASSRLVDNLAKQGYRIPTEVQLGSLPLLLDPAFALQDTLGDKPNVKLEKGVHFCAVAPTGSGKTLAFLIPAINGIMKRRATGEVTSSGGGPEAIVVAPTRELAHQIANEGRKLAAGTGVKVVLFKKGMRVQAEGQEEEAGDSDDSDHDEEESDDDASSAASGDEGAKDKAKDGVPISLRPVTKADILVTTPMLLLNFLTKGAKTKRTLPDVKSLILDESDVLFDPLFRDQTLATMGSNIEALVMEQLVARQSDTSPTPFVRLVIGLKDTAVPSVNHSLIYTGDNERGKLYTLRQLLHPTSSSSTLPDMRLPFLVFVQTIERATSLHEELKFEFPVEAGGSTRIASLHSGLSEVARSKIISQFRAGEIWVLITTDLLMRGIDFRGVNGVINFDVPTSAAAYVHRVGRTGRAGHEGGVAVTFYTKEDVPHLRNIANVISLSEKQAGKSSEEGLPKWLMDALPKVKKEDRQKLKKQGVESRRGSKAQITTKSAWERKKENNRQGAIAGNKKRRVGERAVGKDEGQDSEWGGLDD